MAKRKKKVVRVEPTEKAKPSAGSDWKPEPEAKAEATKLRLIAGLLWLLAIAGEAFAIFWVLQQDPIKMWLLIVMLVVIGALAIGGSLLWKKSNRLDPASKSDTIRFFVQNQLGAIITVIAFLPLIVLIFLEKDLDKNQKAIAGGIGVVVMLVAGYVGIDTDAPSTEQYGAEEQQVIELTGQNLVFWTTHGEVFHLCEDASAVNLESEDNTIFSGTVADAHAAGMDRLTKQIDQEINQCGLDPAGAANVDVDVDETLVPATTG